MERFQQTMKKWLRAQPTQPATISELQTLLDTFVELKRLDCVGSVLAADWRSPDTALQLQVALRLHALRAGTSHLKA